MLAAIPPAVVPALLLILLGTQIAYVLTPGRPPYLIRLALSTLAVLVGEVIGAAGLGQALALGDLHPAGDLALLAVFQWLAGRLAGRAQPV